MEQLPQEPAAARGEQPKINWKYQIEQYGAALVIAIPLYLAFAIYLFSRRGYMNLYIANKIFAGEAAALLGIVLLLGPLSRYFKVFDKYLQYRKELGIVAFFLVIAHASASYFFLGDYFSRERFFTSGLWPFVYGLAATILIAVIFFISNRWAQQKFGSKRWWKIQNWGARVLFALVALHVGIMKWSGWVSWYEKGGGKELVRPEWPGAGLLVGWFMAFVIFVRVTELAGKKFGRAMWYVGIIGLVGIYVFTFWWGLRFAR